MDIQVGQPRRIPFQNAQKPYGFNPVVEADAVLDRSVQRMSLSKYHVDVRPRRPEQCAISADL